MLLSIPSYIEETGIKDKPIVHDWDDSNPEQVYSKYDERLRHRIGKVSYRGVLALSLGFTEWIAWRLSEHFNDPSPFQMIEAAWAGIIDWRYLEVIESPSWDDWQGPILGPLCEAMDLLDEIIDLVSRNKFASPESASLSQLALHIMSNPSPYKEWRRSIIHRLSDLYPRTTGDLLGPPIPREALDPAFNYQPDIALDLLRNYLKNLDYSQNPFLCSPEVMILEGFKGTPYSL